VAVLSPRQAWAVGAYATSAASQTLIEHWNGRAWALVPSPGPGGSSHDNALFGVAAASARNAWAVGYYFNRTAGQKQTLIEHWNGRTWAQVPSPNPGGSSLGNVLRGVAATSARNAWAVGYYFTVRGSAAALHTLVEHWNGSTWARVPSPSPGGTVTQALLNGVAATSARNAWAVGNYYNNTAEVDQTLIEHWNGRTWARVPSPNPAHFFGDALLGVAATSARNAWAVGSGNDYTDDTFRRLIQHWDGTAWKDNPARSIGLLTGVAATSARNAWTAGTTLRWDGTAWRPVPSPAGPAASLNGVAATSPVNAWAVGSTGACRTLILHWDGTAWTQVPSPSPAGSPSGHPPDGMFLHGVAAPPPTSAGAGRPPLARQHRSDAHSGLL
jgi:hypothetical protein